MNVLTIDIGGTFIKYARMDEEARILSRGKVPTPQEGREELIEAIGRLYDEAPGIDGIAISMPGIIDSENGYCKMGGALRYNDDFYLRRRLYERCPVKICLENDAKCAAMAEAAVGSLRDVSDGFVLIFGTMIGGGYIKDRKLHRGRHFSAGEVSYITTVRDGMADRDTLWGRRCGTPRLCALFAERKGLPAEEVDGVRVFEAVLVSGVDGLPRRRRGRGRLPPELHQRGGRPDLQFADRAGPGALRHRRRHQRTACFHREHPEPSQGSVRRLSL